MLTVDYVHDLICPWCRIGHTNLQSVLADWEGPPVLVNYHPFLLNPELPPGGSDFQTYLRQKFGVTDLAQMLAHVTAASGKAGLTCNWDGVKKVINSIDAHRLITMTPPAYQSGLVSEIQDAYFECGEDIGNLPTLSRIAARHGWQETEALQRLQGDELREEIAIAAEGAAHSGVRGVPFYIFNGVTTISGAQPPESISAALQQSVTKPVI